MRAPWLRLGLDSQLGATQDQRGVVTVETGASGVADVLAWVGKDASDAYVRRVIAETNSDPELNSLIVDGGVRIGGTTGTPTRTIGTSAGNTATLTATAGGDAHGEFTLNVLGTGISTGQMVTITFQFPLANANYDVLFMERNANATTVGRYLAARSTTAFTMSFATAPTSGQAYTFSYLVIGR